MKHYMKEEFNRDRSSEKKSNKILEIKSSVSQIK
jgi:hypothetical protein